MPEVMKVVITDVLSDEFEKRWREDLSGLPIELGLVRDPSEDALRKAVAGANVVVTRNRPVDKELLDTAGKGLRMVIKLSRWRIGINEKVCVDRDIVVANVPQLGCITVAEHAMTLLLMCARDMIRSHLGVMNGDYRNHNLTPKVTSERSFAFKWLPVSPFEPYGKRLGIVGLGEIGRELSQRALAFGMKVIYFDQQRLPEQWERALTVAYRPLQELLSESDFASLHIPHTPQTDKLMSQAQFACMKKTAYLINACRGGVIDELALVEALRSGQIAGAGLDVFVEEPLPHDHPLTQLDNVVLSPHIGGGAGTGRADQKRQVRELIEKQLG